MTPEEMYKQRGRELGRIIGVYKQRLIAEAQAAGNIIREDETEEEYVLRLVQEKFLGVSYKEHGTDSIGV